MKVKFDCIGGYEFQKEEAMKIANFFKNYDLFKSNGARLPKGVIFYGRPGTGKTLFANAIVNESGVKAFPLTTDKFYDESNSPIAIRSVFDEARENAPSIILIDEVDQLIPSSLVNNGTDKQTATLRALLTEIDRIKDDDILVIATSNKDIIYLPPALIRDGRIEKHVKVDLPDKEERKEILSIYLSKSKVFKDISIDELASYTSNFSGASLSCLVNEVLIDCITKGRDATFADFLEPIETISSSGIKQKETKDNTSTIYHELGHFICDYALNGKLGLISIVPHTGSNGRYRYVEKEKAKGHDSLTELTNECVVGIGGYTACKIFLNEPYMGASNDIDKITAVYKSVAQSGLRGNAVMATYLVSLSNINGTFNDVDGVVAKDFIAFLNECEAKASEIINANRPLINILFNKLKDKSVLTCQEIEEIINKYKTCK